MTIKMSVKLFLTIFLVGIFLFLSPAEADSGIIINEICPTGCAGGDHQWVEIYNNSGAAIDLTGWKFWENSTRHGLSISASSTEQSFILESGEYAAVVQDDQVFFADYPLFSSLILDSSWIALNKGGEEIGLKDSSDSFVEQFTYKAITNYSLQHKDLVVFASDVGNWCEHENGNTVGAVNVCPTVILETPTTTHATSTTTTQNTDNRIHLKINEFLPNPDSEEDVSASSPQEWIEIFNPTTSSIMIDGLKLFDAVGEIATPIGTIESGGFFAVELSSSKLNNTGGDSVILKDMTDTVIDSVSYGEVAKGNSIARSVDGAGSFAETTTLTKNAANQITAPVQSVQSSSSGGGGGSSSPQIQSTVSYQTDSVVINEMVSDPTDDADEFIELFNNTNAVIDLRQWWLEDGSEARTNLDGQILPRGFFTVNNPVGNLNNSGDIIILFDPSGKTIDQLTYGGWNDGSLNDNAPAAEDPLSLSRKVDGRDTNNDYYDFALTGQITKGGANKIVSITLEGEKLSEAIIISSPIILNEIFPNPKGSDISEEFIELRNLGENQVDLTGWQMSDASDKKYKINQGVIPAGGYIAFKRSLTGIALNNSGQEEVKLYNQNGALVDKIKYEGSVAEDQSYSRRDDGSWSWTIKTTAGKENIIEGKSAAPIIVLEFSPEAGLNEEIIFDASDTTDPEGDAIKFSWDFGDGSTSSPQVGDVVKYKYNKIGEYSVKLTVTDSAGNAAEKIVKVRVENTPLAPLREGSSRFPSSEEGEGGVGGWIDLASQVIISEIFPNPVGSDSAEFIELFNPANTTIDLSNYKIDDEDGGSRPHILPEGTIIESLGFLLLERSKTGLALNNTSDAVRILDQDNTVIAEVDYDDVVEGASYAYDNISNEWFWTAEVTPGNENIVDVRTYEKNTKLQTTPPKADAPRAQKNIIETTLNKLRDNDVGDRIRFTGIVAVRPGVLSSQYFYAVSDDASVGIQVYMNKKDFPLLAVGDLIEVTGEISSAYGETRVKTSVRDDIKLLKQSTLPAPQEIEIASVNEEFEGALIKIKGEITDLKSSYMYVDDGTEELKVYFKKGAGVDRKVFRVGDTVEVTGLLGSTRAGYQLLPREQGDIDVISVSAEDVEVVSAETGTGGPDNMAETYLTVTAGGLTSILIGLFARARGAVAFGLVKRAGKLAVMVIRRTPRV